MNLTKKTFIMLLTALACYISGCSEENGREKEVNFDQQAMLTNIGQQIIFPNYANFRAKTNALQAAVTAFAAEPTAESLATARAAQQETYLAWQRVNLYEFGPAESLALRDNVNSFPTRHTSIENKIASGSWNLESFTSVDQKGLPALDYLLFAGADVNETLAAYTAAEHADKRMRYLQDVTNDLQQLATEVYNGWAPEGGNYLGTFSTTTGNSAGSPLSLFVNQLNEGYEMIKNKKLGLPLGIRSIQNEPIPRAVEAYYSGISLNLMQANLRSVEASFKGQANGNDGPGLDDYLDAIYQAGNIQDDLSSEILHQLNTAQQALARINDPLSEAVVNDTQTARKAYDELQNLVVLLKTDMPSALGVLISYIDNDGD